LSIKLEPDLEFSQSRHVRERKAELPYGNRSAEAEHFFDEHNAECGHYKQTFLREQGLRYGVLVLEFGSRAVVFSISP